MEMLPDHATDAASLLEACINILMDINQAKAPMTAITAPLAINA